MHFQKNEKVKIVFSRKLENEVSFVLLLNSFHIGSVTMVYFLESKK